MRACPCARPPDRPFTPSLACPPAYSPSTMRTKIERHHRANLPSLARACSSAPRTTGPRHGPTLCVPTQIHPCTCSPACPSSLSGSARPSGNEAMLSKTMNVRRRLVKPTRSRQNFALFAGCATPLSSLRPSFRKPVGQSVRQHVIHPVGQKNPLHTRKHVLGVAGTHGAEEPLSLKE